MNFPSWPIGGLCDQQCTDELVARLSHRPAHLIGGMISIFETAKPSSVQNRPSSLPTSFLDAMPVEVLHLVLSELDFQSLSRFSRVSRRSKAVAESLPAYIDLLEYAPHILKALGLTRLLCFHSVVTLRVALRCVQCVSCQEFGPYLFLPTCERCCYECLFQNQSLWVIPISQAGKYFGLGPRQLKTLPVMKSIPGVYSAITPVSRQRQLRLVSVRASKKLRISIHGSITDTSPSGLDMGNTEKKATEFYTTKFFRNAPVQPLPENPSRLASTGNVPCNKYWGMASILFPSLLPSNTAENGLWCRGCEWMFEQYRFGQLPSPVVFDSVPQGVDLFFVFLGMQRRARSKSEFREHIKRCYGAQQLARGLTETIENE